MDEGQDGRGQETGWMKDMMDEGQGGRGQETGWMKGRMDAGPQYAAS